MIGARLGDLLTPTEPVNIEFLRTFIRSGYSIRAVETHGYDHRRNLRSFFTSLIGLSEGGHLVGGWSIQHDVTDLKNLHEKVQKAVDQWQTTFDSIADPIMILDHRFRIVRVNPAGVALFGLPAERILGNHCHALMHGTDAPIAVCPVATMMQTKAHVETEIYEEKRDAWFLVSADPLLTKYVRVNYARADEDLIDKVRGVLKCAAIKAPYFGDRRKGALQDIAVVTGGKVISEEMGIKLESATIQDLGRARRIVIDKDNTTFIDGAGKKADIDERVKQLKKEIEIIEQDYDREKAMERLAKLTSGVAIIKVGAATEIEMKEKKARVEDALNATRAAVQEGIVPGGGVALIRCAGALAKAKLEGDARYGIEIVRKAIEEPLKQIAKNAGYEGSVIVEKVREKKGSYGFDADSGEYVDMIKAGIIDPAKVTRLALQNAASVASLLITTRTMVGNKAEKEEEGQG